MDMRVEIGKKIRRLRKEQNLTQLQLAERMSEIQKEKHWGSPQTVSRLENAVNDFGIDTFLAAAKALNVAPAELLQEDEQENLAGHEREN